MQNQDNTDKLSQHRSSQDRNSIVQRIYVNLCPCFIIDSFIDIKKCQNNNTSYQKNGLQGSLKPPNFDNTRSERVSPHENSMLRRQFLFKSVYQHANRFLQDYDESLDKSTVKKWHSYSIYEYKQNELFALGTTKGKVLCKISSIRVQPSMTAKKKTNSTRSYERPTNFYTDSCFDKYWNKRYFLFQKFDQGINLDQESWYSVTPEAVAEYIASKIKCDTVLDGFCGAGGDSIKLANTCCHVIANDICKVKLRCLKNNAKVYCVQNIETINEDFLKIEGIQPDIVYISPPFGPQQNLTNTFESFHMKPPLNKIFAKAIQLSKNIVILLPPNMNVKKLGELIARQFIESKISSIGCSIKIQKIFFLSQLKYLVIYFGSLIQNQINLNDQLLYIYNYLKQGNKKMFNHKKIIKQLRQNYGMINLLNFIFDLDKIKQSGTLIEKLYIYIQQNNLINQQRLTKLIKDQKQSYQIYLQKKNTVADEQQQPAASQIFTQQIDKQRTISFYSGTSQTMKDQQSQQRQVSLLKYPQQNKQWEKSANTIQFGPDDDGLSDGSYHQGFGEFQCYK